MLSTSRNPEIPPASPPHQSSAPWFKVLTGDALMLSLSTAMSFFPLPQPSNVYLEKNVVTPLKVKLTNELLPLLQGDTHDCAKIYGTFSALILESGLSGRAELLEAYSPSGPRWLSTLKELGILLEYHANNKAVEFPAANARELLRQATKLPF